jgi:hypothetical protein
MDRNTFFNANGRGTDITENDNRQLALNLFDWVTDQTPPAVAETSFVQNGPSELRVTFNERLLPGSLTRDDIFMRNGVTGEAIPNARWWIEVDDAPAGTELTVFIKGAQPGGQYWMRINPFRIRDDSGNLNRRRVRAYFTLAQPIHVPPVFSTPAAAVASAAPSTSSTRLFDALFSDEPVVLS